MTTETINIERAVWTPTTPEERQTWLGAKLTETGAEVTVRGMDTKNLRQLVRLDFTSPVQVAALEDVLRVMRVRWEAMGQRV